MFGPSASPMALCAPIFLALGGQRRLTIGQRISLVVVRPFPHRKSLVRGSANAAGEPSPLTDLNGAYPMTDFGLLPAGSEIPDFNGVHAPRTRVTSAPSGLAQWTGSTRRLVRTPAGRPDAARYGCDRLHARRRRAKHGIESRIQC